MINTTMRYKTFDTIQFYSNIFLNYYFIRNNYLRGAKIKKQMFIAKFS